MKKPRLTKVTAPLRVALVACSKTKLDSPAPVRAAELYSPSQLFSAAYGYAGAHNDAVFILSAKHGLVPPDQPLACYEQTLTTMGKAARQAWARGVAAQLDRWSRRWSAAHGRPIGTVELHAGKAYTDFLVPLLTAQGIEVANPLAGLMIGQRKAWYKNRGGRAEATAAVTSELRRFAVRTQDELGLTTFTVVPDGPGQIKLALLVVPRELHGGGRGTAAMAALTRYADERGLRIVLTPSRRGKETTSRARLFRFYKRFGFRKNAGANRDFSTRELMIREPGAA